MGLVVIVGILSSVFVDRLLQKRELVALVVYGFEYCFIFKNQITSSAGSYQI
jgi:hypothetical protein